MSRTTSARLSQVLFAEQTGEVVAALVTIAHPQLGTTLRFSSDATVRLTTDPLVYGTVSRGNTFTFCPFQVQLPDDDGEKAPEIKLVLSNIGREVIQMARSTSTPASVTVEIVLASHPDDVEVTFPAFDLTSADYDVQSISLGLTIDALAAETFPCDTFTPSGFPGLF